MNRKTALGIVGICIFGITALALKPASEQQIAKGQQPQIVADVAGDVRIVYGSGDKIFCATSTDNGSTFSEPQLVGEVKEMHLGMFRGPQVASSKDYTLVSAMDKKGVLHIFQLSHKTGQWKEAAPINDVEDSAPEGLMSLAADDANHFYATWLDVRGDRKNKIYFSKSTNNGLTWSPNQLVYKGPEGPVCECCKPSIAANGSKVAIMFRNKVDGSRDLYLTQSETGGKTFSKPLKLGKDTWKLDACPMDGGGLVISKTNGITTVWQRAGKVYTAKPNAAEQEISAGRRCSIASPENPVITWQQGGDLKLMVLKEDQTVDIGTGGFLKVARTRDGKILCVWEADKAIRYKRL